MTTTTREIIPVQITEQQIGAIPSQLRDLPQWVCARIERVGERVNKEPINAATGTRASSTDPATWAPFASALARARREDLALGFVLAEGGGVVAIDLDHVRDADTGEIEGWAAEIIERGDTYGETSISGAGVHLFALGEKPGERCKRGQIEMYDGERFIVVTGDHLPETPPALAANAELIADVYRMIDPPRQETRRAPAPIDVIDADDAEVLRRCGVVPEFAELWAGGLAGYDSQSSADLRLCGLFAWAGASEDQADRLFRQSGLMRPKWDSRRGTSTYGANTVVLAFRDLTARWQPAATSRPARPVAAAAIADDELPDDVAELKDIIRRLTAALDEALAAQRALEDRVTMLAEVQSRSASILRNRSLGAERQTAVAVANLLANRQTPEATEGAMAPVYLAAVAEAAGVSTDAAARHLDRLHEMGTGLVKETRTIRTKRGVEKRVYLGLEPGSNVIDFAARVAAARPETARHGWGGARVVCQHCGPEAPVEKRTELVCMGCGEVLASKRETLKPQDAATGEESGADELAGVFRQDAATGDEDLADQIERVAAAAAEDGIEAGDVSRQDAVTGIDPAVSVLGYRAEPGHDPERERELQRRQANRRRDARKFLDELRQRAARPRLVGGRLAYDEDRIGERRQGEIAEVRREIEELLHADEVSDDIRREREETGRTPRRLVFGETDRHLDRWTDPTISRAG